jgi:hypothetical protein
MTDFNKNKGNANAPPLADIGDQLSHGGDSTSSRSIMERGNQKHAGRLYRMFWGGLKGLKYQKDQYQGLKDNILICYKGYGWAHWKTPWSRHGKLLSITELTSCLKELIKMEKQLKTLIPDKPKPILPTRARMPFLDR